MPCKGAYLVDSLKSFKQGSGMVRKEGYKQSRYRAGG